MHKVNSPNELEKVIYKVKPDGVADVWLRNNQEVVPATDDMPESYEADEVFCRVDAAAVSEVEIAADFDFWFQQLSDMKEGADASAFGIEEIRLNKLAEISALCTSTIYAGVDVELSDGVQHFSLTEKDQINLFGKQAQLATGADKLEYHQDGSPCKFYSAEDMTQIITAAMAHVSFQTTYCNSMNMWVKGCVKASEIAAINYGDNIPEEYQSEVLKEYLKEAAGE